MDVNEIKAKIEEIVAKLQKDSGLLDKFKKDPVKTVEGLIGVDLPDDVIKKIVDGVKAKIDLKQVGSFLSKIKGLFGKK